MKLKVLLAFALLPLPVIALQVPQSLPSDARIKVVTYDPNNVVKIVGHFGYQTFIVLGQGEEIMDLGGGDSEAWDIGVATNGNSIFIKPKAPDPATNLTVVTNKRHYNFDLVAYPRNSKNKYYMVRFRYPDEEAKARAANGNKARTEALLDTATGTQRHMNYWVQGADSLTPNAAWDDGTFTYLRFAANREFPAVFFAAEDGEESLVNTHVEGDTLVVERMAKKLVLRKGNLVACIFNESYDPNGVALPTGTVSPAVQRVIRAGE